MSDIFDSEIKDMSYVTKGANYRGRKRYDIVYIEIVRNLNIDDKFTCNKQCFFLGCYSWR